MLRSSRHDSDLRQAPLPSSCSERAQHASIMMLQTQSTPGRWSQMRLPPPYQVLPMGQEWPLNTTESSQILWGRRLIGCPKSSSAPPPWHDQRNLNAEAKTCSSSWLRGPGAVPVCSNCAQSRSQVSGGPASVPPPGGDNVLRHCHLLSTTMQDDERDLIAAAAKRHAHPIRPRPIGDSTNLLLGSSLAHPRAHRAQLLKQARLREFTASSCRWDRVDMG